jgi:hypothetical protein
MRSRRWVALLVVVGCAGSLSRSSGDVPFRPQDFRTKAVFELVVRRSRVLRPGASRIVTESAFVTLAHGLVPGNSDGLEIQFFTQPITEAARSDLLDNAGRELRRRDYAALVLLVDKNHRVWQVNASYVIPGTTVARTVAWTPDQLKQFAPYRFDGTRLVLKSKGLHRDSDSEEEQVTLSWDVDVNLPVFERRSR